MKLSQAYWTFRDYLWRLGIINKVLTTSPLSAADMAMQEELLNNVRQIIRLGNKPVDLNVSGKSVKAQVHGCALYIPEGKSEDGPLYFAIIPDLPGNYYQANHVYIVLKFLYVRPLSYLYAIRDATREWLTAFYDAEDSV